MSFKGLTLPKLRKPDFVPGAEKRLALAVAASCVLIAVSGTMSYMIDTDRLDNTFTTGGLKLQQTETEWDPDGYIRPDGEADGRNMYPGYSCFKNPSVKNITGKRNNHAWVRVQLDILGWTEETKSYGLVDATRDELIFYTLRYDASADGENGASASAYPEGEAYKAADIESLPSVNPDYVMLSGTEPGRHVFYLKAPLKSDGTPEGGESSTLFTHVMLPTEWTQDELDTMGDYRISVIMDGVQQHTFPELADAAEYFGDSGSIFSPGSLKSKNGDGMRGDGFLFSGLEDILKDSQVRASYQGIGAGWGDGSGGSGNGGGSGSGGGDSGSTDGDTVGSGLDGSDGSPDGESGSGSGSAGSGDDGGLTAKAWEDRSQSGLISRGQALMAQGDSADVRKMDAWIQDVSSFIQTNPYDLGDTVDDMYNAFYDYRSRDMRDSGTYQRILDGLALLPEGGVRY